MDTETLDRLDKHKKLTWRDTLRDIYETVRFRSVMQRQRHGERFGLRTYSMWQWCVNHSYFIIGGAIIYTNLLKWKERSRRDEVLNALELNRRQFYEKSFDNDYIENAPEGEHRGGLYDGPKGYIQIDEVTGIKTNADGKLTAPPRKELAANLKTAPVTSDMVSHIKELHTTTYTEDALKQGKRQGDKRWTGWM